jgi:outer membrane protein TolC
MVAVVQPLTAFWTIWEAHEVGKIGVDVRRLERETAQRERAGVVAESYLRVLQAREMAGITAQSLEQRRGQVARARALVDEGVIRKDDLLRARLGEADARQQVARASRQVRLAEANLSLVVGVREGQPAMDARPLEGPLASDLIAPPALLAVAEAQALALRSRTEVTTVSRQVAQARGAVAIARSKLLPEVSAIAAFQTSGGSELQSGDQFFFGLNLTWNVWEWGAVWYGVDAASATVRRAEEGLSELREGVRLQVLAAHESARTARELTLLAADAVTIAEENFRLAEVRYQERAATSFDVLDAETQLTQARAQLAAARYEFLIARAGLHRAMGLAPRAIARGGVSR